MRAFIFPGQGSQAVGMGKALAEASAIAREVFQEVDDALGQSLFKLMCEGPDDQLLLTENAQPAIMANAIATLRVMEREGNVTLVEKAHFVAGHSLGEYSALCAAGALDLAMTARLLKLRGQAMQAAVPVGVGAMAALLGADIEKAEALQRQRRRARSAQSLMTMIHRRWLYPAIKAQSNARLSWSKTQVSLGASNAGFYCPFRPPFTAR